MTNDLVKTEAQQGIVSYDMFKQTFDNFFEESKNFVPYIKVTNEWIGYIKKISEGEKETKILKDPRVRILYMNRVYQITYSTGSAWDFRNLAETTEHLDAAKTPFVLFDNPRKRIVTGLKNMNDIKNYYQLGPGEKCDRRAVVYVYNEEIGVVKLFLKLTQLYNKNENDNWYNFNSPIKDGTKEIRDNYKSKVINYTFKMEVNNNWVKPLTTYYPIFTEPKEEPMWEDMDPMKMSYDIYNMIQTQANNRINALLNNEDEEKRYTLYDINNPTEWEQDDEFDKILGWEEVAFMDDKKVIEWEVEVQEESKKNKTKKQSASNDDSDLPF